FSLLPDGARIQVERYRSGDVPRGFRAKLRRTFLERRAMMMVVRTVVIDDAVRAAPAAQVVILGAGLDGRAWRMPELAHSIVFEVDHPDSQREKRGRLVSLTQAAREVRFVPVDFTRDRLDEALAAHGHDPALPTTWIWEGVAMYLDQAAIEATLAVLRQRSPAGSRLIVTYFRPALIAKLVGILVARLGEPLRSAFQPEAWRELLAQHGFRVREDADLCELSARFEREVQEATRPMRHFRIAIAERTAE
ncbi:MAG TPA: SAM-dependent methyltransferase, partial [Polyangiaceae bacterium]|nr:SAM-dependent methyltransferase [Polyangiaceae bacterium]